MQYTITKVTLTLLQVWDMLKFDGMLLLLMLELGKVDDILFVHAYDTIYWLINFLTSKEMNNHVYHSII